MPNNAIRDSSSIPISRAIKKIKKTQLQKQRIIGPQNFYLKDTVDKTNNSNIAINEDHLAQYIAASIIQHNFDGWNYIARSMETLMNGDISSTIHFGYYSELRAVMSIMAYYGIGIFDRRHIYFDSADNYHFFNGSTHVVAKELAIGWSSSSLHKDDILKLIIVNNHTLFEWLSSSNIMSTGPYTTMIVEDWLKKWSMDLNLRSDQTIRNEASYRPHFNINNIDIKESLENISSIWTILEPITNNRFQEIDKYLFRLAIEGVFIKTKNKSVKHPEYIRFIDTMFINMGESTSQYLYDFVLRKKSPHDHYIFTEAKKDLINRQINKNNPFPLLCRAILLLRLATGYANNFLSDNRIDNTSLRFWWEENAVKLGIVNSIPSGVSACDLFLDIQESIDEIRSNLDNINSTRECITKYSFEANNLKQFQRPCFWGLGL